MNKTRWIIFSVVTIGILALLVFLSGSSRIDVSDINPNQTQTANEQNGNISDHIFGDKNSKVVLIEYGDFQCSVCGISYPRIKSVIEEYQNQIRFIYRNFPIGGPGHPYSMVIAAAAEAAGLQGKYWEMYNLVFERQNEWTNLDTSKLDNTLKEYAEELGLNISKFNSDRKSQRVSKKINYDKAIGQKKGVDGTPTLFLNGSKIESINWNSEESETRIKEAINLELERAGIPLPENQRD